MKKRSILFYGFALIAIFILTDSINAHKHLTGSWEFSVNQAPWEYSKGKVMFETNKEDVITGKIVFTSGAEIKIAKITSEENKLTFEVIIDGYRVKTVATIKDNAMTGVVETNEGNMPFIAKKAIPES